VTDQVTLGATHEVVIDGLKSWIKCEVTLEHIKSVEDIEGTWERASRILSQKVIAEVEKQAAIVVAANKKQREG